MRFYLQVVNAVYFLEAKFRTIAHGNTREGFKRHWVSKMVKKLRFLTNKPFYLGNDRR